MRLGFPYNIRSFFPEKKGPYIGRKVPTGYFGFGGGQINLAPGGIRAWVFQLIVRILRMLSWLCVRNRIETL